MKVSERIAELEEETDALRAGLDEHVERFDAAVDVIELLLWYAANDDPAEWARKLDRLLGQYQTRSRRHDRADVEWLARLLETLISLRECRPAILKAWRDGTLRLKMPRERLRLILGGKASSPRTEPPKPRGRRGRWLRPLK